MKKDALTRALAVLAALAVWQLVAMSVGSRILLATPWQALSRLLALLPTAGLWRTVGCSFVRIAGGFLLALALGVALALAAYRWPPAETLLRPYVVVIKSVPVASFIILALVWLPTGVLPAFICGLMVLPVVWNNVQQGIRETDPKLLETAKVFCMGRWRTLMKVRLPAVMPYFLTAVTTGLGFAWKSGIAAEVICQPKAAIGKRLYLAKIYLETPEVFAWTAVVILLSVLLERLLSVCLRRLAGKYSIKTGGAGK